MVLKKKMEGRREFIPRKVYHHIGFIILFCVVVIAGVLVLFYNPKGVTGMAAYDKSAPSGYFWDQAPLEKEGDSCETDSCVAGIGTVDYCFSVGSGAPLQGGLGQGLCSKTAEKAGWVKCEGVTNVNSIYDNKFLCVSSAKKWKTCDNSLKEKISLDNFLCNSTNSWQSCTSPAKVTSEKKSLYLGAL